MRSRKNVLGISGWLPLGEVAGLTARKSLQNPKQTTSYGNSLRQLQKLGWALVLAQNRSKAAGGKWKSGKSSNQPTCGLFSPTPSRFSRTFSLINLLMYLLSTYLYNKMEISLKVEDLLHCKGITS